MGDDFLGGLYDFIQNNQGLLNLIAGGIGYFDKRGTADALSEFATGGITDPFGTERPLYQQKLRSLYADPSGYLETLPGYAFRRDQGEKAINRAAAGRGDFYSGNVLHELSRFNQELARTAYGEEADRLSRLAGAHMDPSTGQALQALLASRGAGSDALGDLFAGLQRGSKDEEDLYEILGQLLGGGGGLGALASFGRGRPGGVSGIFDFGKDVEPGGGGGIPGLPTPPTGSIFDFIGGDTPSPTSTSASTPSAAGGFDLFGGAGTYADLVGPLAGVAPEIFSLGGALGSTLSTSALGPAFSLYPSGGGIVSALGSAGAGAGAATGGIGAGIGGGIASGLEGLGALLGGPGAAALLASPILIPIMGKLLGGSKSSKDRAIWGKFYDQLGSPTTIPAGAPGAGQKGIPFSHQGRTIYLEPSGEKYGKPTGIAPGTSYQDYLDTDPSLIGEGMRIVGTDQVYMPGSSRRKAGIYGIGETAGMRQKTADISTAKQAAGMGLIDLAKPMGSQVGIASLRKQIEDDVR